MNSFLTRLGLKTCQVEERLHAASGLLFSIKLPGTSSVGTLSLSGISISQIDRAFDDLIEGMNANESVCLRLICH